MDHIRRVAFEIVLRACSFRALWISRRQMFGMSDMPKTAFQAGGVWTSAMCVT